MVGFGLLCSTYTSAEGVFKARLGHIDLEVSCLIKLSDMLPIGKKSVLPMSSLEEELDP